MVRMKVFSVHTKTTKLLWKLKLLRKLILNCKVLTHNEIVTMMHVGWWFKCLLSGLVNTFSELENLE